MLTDGVDRYYDTAIMDDPYVDAAIHEALKESVIVYSIYLRGAGAYGRGGWVTNTAQSRLLEVSQETGGHAYFQDFTDPVTISPFLSDFQHRLESQYQVTIEGLSEKGVQPVKVRTELPGRKDSGPNAHLCEVAVSSLDLAERASSSSGIRGCWVNRESAGRLVPVKSLFASTLGTLAVATLAFAQTPRTDSGQRFTGQLRNQWVRH